jgi:hypothetical protein
MMMKCFRIITWNLPSDKRVPTLTCFEINSMMLMILSASVYDLGIDQYGK